MTRSLPLIRPSRASAFGGFLSPLPKRLKSPGEKGNFGTVVEYLTAPNLIQFFKTIKTQALSQYFGQNPQEQNH